MFILPSNQLLFYWVLHMTGKVDDVYPHKTYHMKLGVLIIYISDLC